MFKNVLIVFLIACTAYFAWIACTINNNKMQAIYEEYNHIKIYEDGSYTGELRSTGLENSGCIPEAQCND